jgi:hypothetical protein
MNKKQFLLILSVSMTSLLFAQLDSKDLLSSKNEIKNQTENIDQDNIKPPKEYKGLPEDLDVNKIIFLRLDSANVETERPQIRSERYAWTIKKFHNTRVIRCNEQLKASAALYPFDHVIISRSEIQKYKDLGYKYVLDFAPFNNASQGIIKSDAHTKVKFPVYVMDLTTSDIYKAGYLDEDQRYRYKALMKKYVLNRVKRMYK